MTDKITVKGSAPKFDVQILKQRQAARHNQYHLTSEGYEIVRGAIAFELLENVVGFASQGYIVSNKHPVITAPMSYSAYMRKPDAIQAADLEALDEEVKQKYIADLERERQEYKQLLTQQLLQAADLKEKKKEEERKAKLLKEIEKEVADTFGELVVPA